MVSYSMPSQIILFFQYKINQTSEGRSDIQVKFYISKEEV